MDDYEIQRRAAAIGKRAAQIAILCEAECDKAAEQLGTRTLDMIGLVADALKKTLGEREHPN